MVADRSSVHETCWLERPSAECVDADDPWEINPPQAEPPPNPCVHPGVSENVNYVESN